MRQSVWDAVHQAVASSRLESRTPGRHGSVCAQISNWRRVVMRLMQSTLSVSMGVALLAACERGSRAEAATQRAPADSTPPKVIVPERCAAFPASWTEHVTPRAREVAPAVDSTARDSARTDSSTAKRDSQRVGSGAAGQVTAPTSLDTSRKTRTAPRDTFPTPPTPLPGSVLPGCRIVAFYGNPLSTRMGIMGALPPDKMLAKLDSQARTFEKADSATPVIRALEMITPVAQGSPGPKNLWRTRMADTVIERIAKLAEDNGHLFFLDVQVGKSTVSAELEPLIQFLKRPHVHLALDPEFSMKGTEPPGKKIGTMDAADVNVAIDLLARLVDENHLPPKVLVVHRFTQRMLTNHEKIKRDPRVQVVIDMDGFGPPSLKLGSYDAYVHDRPVQYYGIKLFYKNDKPMFSAGDVMRLFPIPQYVQYQ